MSNRNKSGIYAIWNKINGKHYIGSAVNLGKRFDNHKYDLKTNKHCNIYLQRAWNKYGGLNFKFEVLEYVKDKQQLLSREQYYLDSYINVYNICKIARSRLGVKVTNPETLRRIGLAHIGDHRSKNFSKEAKKRIGNASRKRRLGKIPWNKGLTGISNGSSTLFKKGQVPWNKGILCSIKTKLKISSTKRKNNEQSWVCF